MKAASNAAFANEMCTTQTIRLASGDLINSTILQLLKAMPHHKFFIQDR